MLIIGHRGNGLNEQSLVDMIEVDLRKRGSEIVVSHNRPTKSAELQTLNQLLAQSQVPLNLEFKESGFETEVLEAIKNFSSKVLLSSKYPSILKKIRALDENVDLGLILGRANWFLVPFIKRLDKALKLYSIHPKTFLAKSILIKRFHRLGKKVFVWTVNNLNQFQKLEASGVDGVFTDYPNLIKK